jgi:hypothetical protein
MTRKQILNLRPEFEYKGLTFIDYFIIEESHNFCYIRNAMRNAFEDCMSPYYYDISIYGNNATKRIFKRFSEWWKSNHANKFIKEN